MNKLFEYQQDLDVLRFTDAQKQAIADRAARAAGESAPRRCRPLLQAGLLAACLALALVVGAGATGVLKSAGEIFAPIFGGSVAQTEVIDKIGRPIGASDTSNGVTITADRPMIGRTATVEFQDLCGWDDAAGEPVPVVKGHWKFRFDMDYEDSSVTLGGGETFRQNDMTFTVDAITVSPVAVKVDYTVDSEVVWSNAPSGRQDPEDSRQMERYFENVEILLTKTDGTVIGMSNSGGSIEPKHGVTVCSKGEVFDEIIPPEQLESISVGGIVYSLPNQ